MYKFLLSVMLLLVLGRVEAHSHSSVDGLTHSLEHMAMNYSIWMPYLSGFGLVLTIVAALLFRYGRRSQ